MTIYVLLELAMFFMLCMYFILVNKKQFNKVGAVVIFIALVLILGLRHPSMGVDNRFGYEYGYIGSFKIISSMSWSTVLSLESYMNYERGYIIYCKLVGSIWNNVQFFIFVSAFLSLLPIYVLIRKKSENSVMSSFVYLGLPAFLMVYSGIRQSLAIGLCCLAVDYIQRKKIVKFILLIIAASFLHSSVLIFLIAYPIYHFKIGPKGRWYSLLIIPVVYLFRYPLFAVFSKLFKDNVAAVETGSYTLWFVFCAIYIFCIVFCKKDDVEQNGYMNLFFVACIIQTFGSVHHLAMRVGYYFMIILVVLLPSITSKLKTKTNNLVAGFAISAAFAVYSLYAIYTATWAKAYPYYFFWENMII